MADLRLTPGAGSGTLNGTRWVRLVRVGIVLVVVVVAAAYVAMGASHQWDFETYYYAAKAFRTGLNPYDLDALSFVAGRSVELPFVYPPVTLLVFLPFSILPLGLASLGWLAVQCILATSLIWLWRKEFLPSVAPDLLLTVALLGYDLALLWSLRTGNVSLLEQALLWTGFAAYVRRRLLPAAVLIAAASAFKLYPIVFLTLLLSAPVKRGRGVAVGLGIAVFAMLVAVPLVAPESWIRAVAATFTKGHPSLEVNPNALTILESALSLGGVSASSVGRVGPVLYVLFAIALLLISRESLRRVFRAPRPLDCVVTAMMLWFLLSPRTMIYSYVSAIVPSVFILHCGISDRRWRGGSTLALALPGAVRLLPGNPPAWLGVVSFAMILAIWILWTRINAEGSRRLGNDQAGPKTEESRLESTGRTA